MDRFIAYESRSQVVVAADGRTNGDAAGTRRRHVLPWTLGFALVWAVAVHVEGPIRPLDSTFEVSSDRQTAKDSPRLAGLADEGFVVVWEGAEPVPGGTPDGGVRGRLMASDGSPAGDVFQVNAYTTGLQQEPVVDSWDDGRFVVVYSSAEDTVGGASPRHLRARRFDHLGQPLGDEWRIDPGLGDEDLRQSRPAVATFPDGGFIVVWERFEGAGPFDNHRIRARRFDAAGMPTGPSFSVTEDIDGHRRSDVTAFPDGGFAVVWETLLTVETGHRLDVFGKRYDAAGELVGEFVVDGPDGRWRGDPKVAATAAGEFVVAWRDFDAYDTYYPVENVMVRRFDALGLPLGLPENVVSDDEHFRLRPAVSGRPNGEFIVSWAPSNSGPAGFGLRAFQSDGRPRGTSFEAPSDPNITQQSPDVLALDDDRAVVVWSRFDAALGEVAIDGRRFVLPCVPQDTVLCLQDGRFAVRVTWRDFAQRVGPGRTVDGASDDSGLFWFFAEDNWELLVKVVDGCAFNQHYWVFAAGVTDVEYSLRVLDTVTGQEAVYSNPLGRASPAVTDTAAFMACP